MRARSNPFLRSAAFIGISLTLSTLAKADMFDTNGTTLGFGVADATTYNWLDAAGFWNTVNTAAASEGTATTAVWVSTRAAYFVGAGASTTYTVRLGALGDQNTNVGNIAINVNASAASFSPAAAGNVTIGTMGDTGILTTSTNSVGAQGGGTLTINNRISLGGTMNYRGGLVVINGVISGANTIIANNTTTFSSVSGGSLTLTGANTYSGGTTVGSRSIRIGVDSVGSVGSITSSAIGTGGLTINGAGVLSSNGTTARTILNAVTISGAANIGDATNNGKLTFSAAADLGTAVRTITTNSDVQFDGIVSGVLGGITKAGSGTLTLTNANTYNGGTNVNAGILAMSGSGTISGVLAMGGGQFDLGGTSQSVGAVTITAAATGVDTITNGNLTGTSYAASLASGTATISASLRGAAATFTKTGAGTVNLTGVNTYGGLTTLTAGTTQIGVGSVGSVGAITSSAIGTGTLTFNGGILSSNGTTARTILNAITFSGDAGLGNATNNGKLTFSG
jgi:autotransporter-associated beta strand protein